MSFTIYETGKMYVEIHDDVVSKQFKPVRGSKKRYFKEKKALTQLGSVSSIPNLLVSDDKERKLTISKYNGIKPDVLIKKTLLQIRQTIEQCLELGVARHSLPERDILVDEHNNVAVVDFERVTFRSWRYSPVWLIATKVSRFNLLRLIYRYEPKLLSQIEIIELNRGIKVRQKFEIFKQNKIKFRQFIK